MLTIGGLLIALFLWIGAMSGIVWSWNRHVPLVVEAGFDVKKEHRHIDLARVARRHTLGWTAFFSVLFLALALSSFPLWQRVGFAVVLSVIYGLSRIKRGEANRLGKDEPNRVAMFGVTRDRLWYRVLAIGDWAGYLIAIVFATELVALAIGQ
jgi:hypothetical protein